MNKCKIIISLLAVLIITFFSFYPSLKNGFTNWDDEMYVTENYVIWNLSWSNIKLAFGSILGGNYHPLTILAYSLDHSLFKLNPLGYHLTNLILHLLNSLLVFWLICILTKSAPLALITAIFFGIHPLHVESVAWISERKDVLYALFFLGAMILYVYYLRENKISKYYYFSLILFSMSLLSKAMAVTLPLVLLFIDYLLYRKPNKAMILDKIPFFILSFVFTIIAVFAQYSDASIRKEGVFNLLNKFAVASYSIIFYLGKILMPVKMSCLYPYLKLGQHILTYLYPSIAVIILLIAMVISGRYTRKVIFAGSFFLVTIIPVLQFVPLGNIIVADRYVYIPSLGIFYALAVGFGWLSARRIKCLRLLQVSLLMFLIMIISTLAFFTWKRCQVWKDSITLWSDALNNYPDVSAVAYNNRGNAYQGQGNLDRALADYNQALKISPNLAEGYNNRGNVYKSQGDFNQALADYNQALKISPNLAAAHNSRGLIYQSRGDLKQALLDYGQAIQADPNYALVYNNRGNVYRIQGKLIPALLDYNKAIEINPNYALAYNNRGNIYQGQGKLTQALLDYNKAIEANPQYAIAYNNRGNIYQRQGKFALALADYNQALKISPNLAEAHSNRGSIYQGQGRSKEALSDYNQALKLNLSLSETYSHRASLYLLKQEYQKSWEDIHKAESLGYPIDSRLIEKLKKASGRER